MKQSKLKALAFAVTSTLLLGTALQGYAADNTKFGPSTNNTTATDQNGKEKSGSVGQYVDDATITTRVKSRFASDSTVSATRIKVETVKGVVELSGSVESNAERDQAVNIARGVPDVRGVRNNLTIQAAADQSNKSKTNGADAKKHSSSPSAAPTTPGSP